MMDSVIWLGVGLLLMQGAAWLKRVNVFAPAFIILTGLALGPFGFNAITLGTFEKIITDIVLIVILFAAGIGICWPRFLGAVKPGLLVGIGGIVLSFGFGFLAAYALASPLEEALYIGVALTATSIGLSVPLLTNSGVLSTKVGQILLASAIVDDILALYLLSSIHVALSSENGLTTVIVSLMIGLVGLVSVALVVYGVHRWFSDTRFYQFRYLRLLVLILLAMVSALVTHRLGLSLALGGFVAGASLAFRHGKTLQKDIRFYKRAGEYIAPLFFLSIGMQIAQVDLGDIHLSLLILAVLMAAVAGKFLCPWLIAAQLNSSERRLLGVALIPRGEVGLIVAGIGLQQKHLSDHGMVALVIMTLVTTLVATILIPRLAQRVLHKVR